MLKIRELREEKGISQAELAEELGVSQMAVSRWERECDPKASRILQIAKVLGCTLNELFGIGESELV